MTITKVKYEKLFPTGAYLNEKIGFEAEIGSYPVATPEDFPEGLHSIRIESPEEVVNKLRDLCESIHRQAYPHLYTESGKPITIEQVPDVQVRKGNTGDIFQDIASCTEIKVLETYKLLVKGFPDRQAAYDLKMGELKKDLDETK